MELRHRTGAADLRAKTARGRGETAASLLVLLRSTDVEAEPARSTKPDDCTMTDILFQSGYFPVEMLSEDGSGFVQI
jgi:hypothetical protein